MKKILIYICIFLTLSFLDIAILFIALFTTAYYLQDNDGIEQMIPIQMFLFDKWSVGNLFMLLILV